MTRQNTKYFSLFLECRCLWFNLYKRKEKKNQIFLKKNNQEYKNVKRVTGKIVVYFQSNYFFNLLWCQLWNTKKESKNFVIFFNIEFFTLTAIESTWINMYLYSQYFPLFFFLCLLSEINNKKRLNCKEPFTCGEIWMIFQKKRIKYFSFHELLFCFFPFFLFFSCDKVLKGNSISLVLKKDYCRYCKEVMKKKSFWFSF